ncbi:MAG: aspartate aminotransferase family protein [Bryobacteraceae bacterium]
MRTFERSRALLERARQSLAGGVSSPFRALAPEPLYFADGCGARLEDVDGNRYIDYQLAWGPMILGYRHPKLVEAMRRQAERPMSYGAQHDLEISVAERIQAMVPCAERIAFTSSGSEAVQLVHRLCRAFTSRDLILKFEGHYHGWMDSTLISYHPPADKFGPLNAPHPVLPSRGQVSNVAENTVVAPWNRLDLLEALLERHSGRIAAVMMEPVLCNSGCILPKPGYLEGVRDLCRKHGALLVFDEVITGFRMGPGGAQTAFGITPDLATFGKAVAGGAPLSVVAGRREILEQMFGGGVSFGGTFNGNPVSLAAADATLEELSRDGGAVLAEVNRNGSGLQDGIRNLAKKHGVHLVVSGFGAAFAVHFTTKSELSDYRDTLDDDSGLLKEFLLNALQQGVYSVPDGRFYTSAAHGEVEIQETLEALDRVLGVYKPASPG